MLEYTVWCAAHSGCSRLIEEEREFKKRRDQKESAEDSDEKWEVSDQESWDEIRRRFLDKMKDVTASNQMSEAGETLGTKDRVDEDDEDDDDDDDDQGVTEDEDRGGDKLLEKNAAMLGVHEGEALASVHPDGNDLDDLINTIESQNPEAAETAIKERQARIKA